MNDKATDILQSLRNNNQWSASFSLQAKIKYSSTLNDKITTTELTFIRDHDRCQMKGWGILKTAQGVILEEANHIRYIIMNGEKYLVAIGPDLDTLWTGSIKETDYDVIRSGMLNDATIGSPIWGGTDANSGMDIYSLIQQSNHVTHGKSDDSIDGLACDEITGTSKYGRTKIVFSPEIGYVPLKWEIDKAPGDYCNTKVLPDGMKKRKLSFQASEITRIGEFDIPLKGHMQDTIESEDDQFPSQHIDYEWSNIQPSPDFEAVNAFEFDLPSHVRVGIESCPDMVFHFKNGKLIPKGD